MLVYSDLHSYSTHSKARYVQLFVGRLLKCKFILSTVTNSDIFLAKIQLGTGTGVAPFRSFLWKMFFEKHEDYQVCSLTLPLKLLITVLTTEFLPRSSMAWHGFSWEFQQAAHCCTKRLSLVH